MFENDVHAFLLTVSGQRLQAFNTISHAFIQWNFSTVRIFSLSPFITSKCNNAGEAGVRALVDHLFCSSDDFIVVVEIVQPFHERSTRHSVWSNGTGQPVFLETSPRFRAAEFNRLAAEFLCDLTCLVNVPFVSGHIEAPENDRLFNSSVHCCFLRISSRRCQSWNNRRHRRHTGSSVEKVTSCKSAVVWGSHAVSL